MTPSKSGSRTEERGRGDLQRRPPVPLPAYGRPSSIRHPPLTALVAASPDPAPMRWADPSHLAAGAIHLCTPSRADPLASAGRSAFTLRGSDPPRQLWPALVCLRRDQLLLCEAIRLRLWLSSPGLSRSAPPCLARNALRWRSARCRWPGSSSFSRSVARDVRVARPHNRLALSRRLCGGAPLRPRATNRWSLGSA